MLATVLSPLKAQVQRFYNLTADEVAIGQTLPEFTCSMPLDGNFADSLYTVSLLYPEFIDMTPSDISAMKALGVDTLPAMPVVSSHVAMDRKRGVLEAGFCPLVHRDGRYRILVSFMLKVESRHGATPLRSHANAIKRSGADNGSLDANGNSHSGAANTSSAASRYVASSVLSTGRWAKIRVPSTGVYHITDALIRQAGFSDPSHVKVYGYGGNLINEQLVGSELAESDDLKEVATCTVGGRRLLYAKGPVHWTAKGERRRVRNPYSDYGYYFLTQDNEGTPASISEEEFVALFSDSPDRYHSLHESDGYSWFHGGRNLVDGKSVAVGETQKITIADNPAASRARATVVVTSNIASTVEVLVNGESMGSITVLLGNEDDAVSYNKANERSATYTLSDAVDGKYVFTIKPVAGGPVRLDYIDITWDEPIAVPSLADTQFPSPEYVYNITNQNHHADPQADMVIIIPTSQKLLAQATRLAEFHRQHDGMRVNIVPADELYNEFSSGTPDASAYRRYMKMLYDRAESEADLPGYLVLFGDGVWDNRMLTPDCRSFVLDDYLLCYESENSYSEVECYVDDGFFCYLDDGEGLLPTSRDKLDVAVGRFPVTTESDAKGIVDKVIAYASNKNAGAWRNTLVFMGDDGNNNLHMRDENQTADKTSALYPGYLVKKVMWDAYKRETSATGNTYPEVTRLLKQQQQQGALVMNYAGHGSSLQLSHENVLRVSDFKEFTNTNLPLWISASCDVLPFDGNTVTLGEAAVINPKGGAVAFFGTTRTVFTNYNKTINQAYMRHVLSLDDNGRPITIGEAQRRAKNEMVETGGDLTVNKLQYTLLGDPALPLALPTMKVVVDKINGVETGSATLPRLKAGSVATVEGHIEGGDNFNGVATATVRDTRELITCRQNDAHDKDGSKYAFEFYDRPRTIYAGSDSVRAGKFEFTFAVPKDINYEEGSGLINIYAISSDHNTSAHGSSESFIVNGSELAENDSIGPSIYCYLNSPSFTNGGKVNTTPFFVATINDQDGINASGSGIGHDMQLVIDGDMGKTYSLNDNFSYDFGTYTSGSTYYSLPELEPGEHRLLFRAWDVLNNASTAELTFTVVKGLRPTLFNVSCTDNPATTSTTFIISHDRTGSTVDVDIDIFDMSGRQLWRHSESGVSTDNAYTVEWNLTTDGGRRLQTGVYLYRARISCDGSSKVSKAKKLVIIGNK